jgi:hypothetical protein
MVSQRFGQDNSIVECPETQVMGHFLFRINHLARPLTSRMLDATFPQPVPSGHDLS